MKRNGCLSKRLFFLVVSVILLALAFPVFGQDDCSDCPNKNNVKAWSDILDQNKKMDEYESINNVGVVTYDSRADIKTALELALKYLDRITVNDNDNIQDLLSGDYPSILKRISIEYTKREKDIQFIRKVYEENF